MNSPKQDFLRQQHDRTVYVNSVKKTLEDLPQEGAKERGLSMLLLQELNLFALNALVRKQKKKKKKEYCL